MLDGQQDMASNVSGMGHQYAVFVGPTRAQLDNCWTGVAPSRSAGSLQWKMNRYYTSINNESRHTAMSTQKNEEGMDPLIAVRRKLRRRVSRPTEDSSMLQIKAPRRSQTSGIPICHTSNSAPTAVQSCDEDSGVKEAMPSCAGDTDVEEEVQKVPISESCTVPASVVPSEHRTRPVLGPARRVGISGAELTRQARKRPPFLKSLERSRVKETQARNTTSVAVPEASKNITVSGNIPVGNATDATATDLEVTTTFDSIPPPPAHSFVLSALSDIGRLLRSPEPFLPITKGGGQDGDAPSINLLVLVRNIGAVEQVHNWRVHKSRMASLSCDITVQDRKGCLLKVVITGECARRWVDGSCEDSSYSWRRRSQVLRDRSNLCDSMGNTTSAFSKQDRLLPIRSGDVIALSDLRLSRRRKSAVQTTKTTELSHSVFAAASDQHHSTLELCWRNELIDSHDDQVNFDAALTVFDARCRAIYELAQTWKTV